MTYGYGGDSAILGIGTALPPHCIRQEEAAERVALTLAEQAVAAKRTRRLFRQCGVETRYTCERSFAAEAERSRYLVAAASSSPSTGERGETYREHALPLALAAAKRALHDAGVGVKDITHLFAVSCTGLYLPGLDAELVRHLGLRRDVQRLPLSFAGCAAGLKAIGIAAGITAHEREAKALVVCVELCSLHVQPGAGRNELLAAAMFGDGAAACVVGQPGVAAGDVNTEETIRTAGTPATSGMPGTVGSHGSRGLFMLGRYRSVLLEEGAAEMTWRIGDNGYELFLSPRIPELLVSQVPEQLARLTAELSRREPQLWAIHPGGRGILDALQRLYGLSERQLAPSRTVLNHIGNVSSATILFVLDELRRSLAADGAAGHDDKESKEDGEANGCGVALAFGPGLTAELLTFVYSAQAAAIPTTEEGTGCVDEIFANGTSEWS